MFIGVISAELISNLFEEGLCNYNLIKFIMVSGY
jgi:hypothetical protein